MPTNPSNDKSCTITVAAAIVVQADLKAGISLSSEKRSARPRATGKPSCNLKPSFEIPKLPERDADFWYPDGNVVIKAGTFIFKLHRSRLSKYSAYFRKVFVVEEETTLTKDSVFDGCSFHRLPTSVSAEAFKQFLIALEMPLAFVKEQPSEADAYTMLDTSHALSRSELAKDRLAQVWDSKAVPSEGTGFNYKYASLKIAFFRDRGIPEFLKRAYYETLTDWDFWKALSKDRGYVPTLSDMDIHIMYEARYTLQRLWREFVVIPPRTSKDGVSTCARPSKSDPYPAACITHTSSAQRSHLWFVFVIQDGQLKEGARDPVRYNMIKTWRPVLAMEWCGDCLDERENAWLEKRREWWILLDKLLKL